MIKSRLGNRREEAAARRELILAEAIQLMGLRGYRGFTLQQLAKQCELTNGGVLHHFPSKEAVLSGVLEELERRMATGVSAYVAENLGRPGDGQWSRDAVLLVLRGMLIQSLHNADALRVLTMLQIEAWDPGHPAHHRMRRSTQSTFEQLSALFESISDNPQRTARQALAMLNGLYLLWLDDASFDLMEEWDGAIEKILSDKPIDGGVSCAGFGPD